MNDRAFFIAMRLVHIVFGVLWVGGVGALVFFVIPAARRGALPVLRHLIRETAFIRYLNAILGLNMLAGLALYARLSYLTQGAWSRSHTGVAYGVGAVAAIAAAGIANGAGATSVHRAFDLDAAGAPGSGEALARYARWMSLVVALLILTVATMAVGRYLG